MSKITYHQQFSYCGKPHCRKCREGVGHGPYWYAYQTVNGRTIRTYVGKQLPAGVLGAALKETRELGTAQELSSAVARLHVLGQFRLENRSYNWKWQVVHDGEWLGLHPQALLAYLAGRPGRGANHAQILAALWPDLSEKTASLQLERAVAALRRLLAPARKRKRLQDMLRWDGEWLSLANQSLIWIDADAFESLFSQARGNLDPGQTEQLLEEAALLYSGDFLHEDRNVPWTQPRREALQHSWVSLLLELADLRIAREAKSAAIDILDRLLAVDPANEAAVQRLVILLAQLGRRAEALRVYRRCVDALWRDYDLRPSSELQGFIERLQRGEDVRL